MAEWSSSGTQFEGPSGVQAVLGGQLEGANGVQVALGVQFGGPNGDQVAPRSKGQVESKWRLEGSLNGQVERTRLSKSTWRAACRHSKSS